MLEKLKELQAKYGELEHLLKAQKNLQPAAGAHRGCERAQAAIKKGQDFMKRIASIALAIALMLALIPAAAGSTVITFPDPYFEAAVREQIGKPTGDILVSDVAELTWFGTSDSNITDFSGIEHFTALTGLNVYNAQITTLDISRNTALTALNIYNTPLTTLDVGRNAALTWLSLERSQLTALDVSNNTALTGLRVSSPTLTTLDVSRNTALMELYVTAPTLTMLDVSNNTALIALEINEAPLRTLDVSHNTSLEMLRILITSSLSGNNLTTLDLTRNTALRSLTVFGNRLTELDVSRNTSLTSLGVSRTPIRTLDVSHNTQLTSLLVTNTRLTSLDVSRNTELMLLYAERNQLTALDVSNNTALTSLDVRRNRLTELDISRNTELTRLDVSGNLIPSASHITGLAATLAESDAFVFDPQRDAAEIERFENNVTLYNESEVKRDFLAQMPHLDIPEEITALAKSITEGMTDDYEKMTAIHDWVADNVWYNMDWYARKIPPLYTVPLDVLQYKHTVCEGYAWLTMYLLRAAGIPAVYVLGTVLVGYTSWEGHAWNEAYVDGRWIMMDATWNSGNRYEHGTFSDQRFGGYVYFDMSPEELSESHRITGYRTQPGASAPNLGAATFWARPGIQEAFAKGFIPEDLQENYTSIITRAEFCRMAVKWVEYAIKQKRRRNPVRKGLVP